MNLHPRRRGPASIALTSGAILVYGLIVAAPASAQSAHSQTVAPPPVISCTPAAGTVISTTATSSQTAWLPSNIRSSYVAGYGTVTLSETQQSDISNSVSATFTFSASDLFTSASANYGVTLGTSSSTTQGWLYSITVPSGITAQIQQYKEGSDLGIKSVQEVLLSPTSCGTKTSTSAGNNFYPYSSTSAGTFCYALVSSIPSRTAAIQINSGCSPND